MLLTTKVTFTAVVADLNKVKIGFESHLTALVAADSILARKAKRGRVVTLDCSISPTVDKADHKKVYLNLNIRQVVDIKEVEDDTRFDDLEDATHEIKFAKAGDVPNIAETVGRV
jgi:hypothetical protein